MASKSKAIVLIPVRSTKAPAASSSPLTSSSILSVVASSCAEQEQKAIPMGFSEQDVRRFLQFPNRSGRGSPPSENTVNAYFSTVKRFSTYVSIQTQFKVQSVREGLQNMNLIQNFLEFFSGKARNPSRLHPVSKWTLSTDANHLLEIMRSVSQFEGEIDIFPVDEMEKMAARISTAAHNEAKMNNVASLKRSGKFIDWFDAIAASCALVNLWKREIVNTPGRARAAQNALTAVWYTAQPPGRNKEVYTLQIAKNKRDYKGMKNCVYFNNERWILKITDFKTRSFMQPFVIYLDNATQDLISLLNECTTLSHRALLQGTAHKFLFIRSNGDHFSLNSGSQWTLHLQNVFRIGLEASGFGERTGFLKISSTALRSSFISTIIPIVKNLDELQQIAFSMRTSVHMMYKYYDKNRDTLAQKGANIAIEIYEKKLRNKKRKNNNDNESEDSESEDIDTILEDGKDDDDECSDGAESRKESHSNQKKKTRH